MTEKPDILMTETELKKKYDGIICPECGKPYKYQIVKNKDGSESIYPHGRRAAWIHAFPHMFVDSLMTLTISISNSLSKVRKAIRK